MESQSFVVLLQHRHHAHVRLLNTVVARGLELDGIAYDIDEAGAVAICVIDVTGRPEQVRRLPEQLRRVVAVLDVTPGS